MLSDKSYPQSQSIQYSLCKIEKKSMLFLDNELESSSGIILKLWLNLGVQKTNTQKTKT